MPSLGELDDQLLPVGKEMFVYEEEEEWADEDDTGGQARPGTTKRKQYYTKKVRYEWRLLGFRNKL